MYLLCLFFSLGKRRTVKCPVQGCSKEIVNISRHLQGKSPHWLKKSSQKAMFYFDLRKRSSDIPVLTNCPFPSCMSNVRRIDDHLKKVHSLKSSDQDFKRIIKTSGKFTPSDVQQNTFFYQKSL